MLARMASGGQIGMIPSFGFVRLPTILHTMTRIGEGEAAARDEAGVASSLQVYLPIGILRGHPKPVTVASVRSPFPLLSPV
jgi:hypothetical protein